MRVFIAYSDCYREDNVLSFLPDDATWVFIPMDKKYHKFIEHCIKKNIPITVVPVSWMGSDFGATMSVMEVISHVDKAVVCWDGGYDEAMDAKVACRVLKIPCKIALDYNYHYGKEFPTFFNSVEECERYEASFDEREKG